jgi:hypothetical protein
VEKEHAVYERLERIDGLRSGSAPADVLLDEVRALLAEAEDWVRDDSSASSRTIAAIERTKAALEAGDVLSLR